MSEKRKSNNRFSSLPPLSGAFCMELSANREAVLEGAKGVLEYSPQRIRVNTSGMIIVFSGRDLDLKCISESSLIIAGFITDIAFSV